MEKPISISRISPANKIMELQMFAANPISNPVIPSFKTITAYPITPEYSMWEVSTSPTIRSDTKKEKPILTLAGMLDIEKKGAI
jgi:hypothetical protein